MRGLPGPGNQVTTNLEEKAHELTDSLAVVATFTKDGKALFERAIGAALQDAYDLGWKAKGEAIDTKIERLESEIENLKRIARRF